MGLCEEQTKIYSVFSCWKCSPPSELTNTFHVCGQTEIWHIWTSHHALMSLVLKCVETRECIMTCEICSRRKIFGKYPIQFKSLHHTRPIWLQKTRTEYFLILCIFYLNCHFFEVGGGSTVHARIFRFWVN